MTKPRDNPWTQLPKQPPFVIPPDRPFIDAYNSDRKEYVGSWIHTGRVPEPRQGPIDAPVIILQQNPSYSGRPPQEALPQQEIEALQQALVDEYSPHQGLIRPNGWWDRTCKVLREKKPRELLARRILSVEYFPYPSATFDHHSLRLPSQPYVFDLVRDGLARGALFVITRGATLWYGAVPDLHIQRGTTVFLTKNPQSPYITPGNLPDEVFERICTLI
jgi:hypothetical protein